MSAKNKMREDPAFTVIIPARYASSRFPGKMLASLRGKPILLLVYEAAVASRAGRVVIATDDERIAELAGGAGATVVMTSSDLRSGTERVHAAAKALKLDANEILINVQGDEPLLPSANIRQVAEVLADDSEAGMAGMATLATPITDARELADPNCVKVVCNQKEHAIYFSRSPIPCAADRETNLPAAEGQSNRSDRDGRGYRGYRGWLRHLGIYAYRFGFLNKYVGWQVAFAEKTERLEQLRALHHGACVRVAIAREESPGGVDTPEDLRYLEGLLAGKR